MLRSSSVDPGPARNPGSTRTGWPSPRGHPATRRIASRAETYSMPVRHSSVRSRCPGSAALAASGSSADGSATGSGVEAIQGLLVLLSDNAALDLERRCQLATIDGEVVVEHRPLLDRLPPIQAGVQLLDVLVDHVVHLVGFREVLIRLAAQPVVFGPPADRILVQSDQRRSEVLALAEHHELTGVRAQRREFRLDGRRCDVLAVGQLEQFFDPASDREEAVVVELALIPGGQPAVLQRLGRRVVQVVIAGHHTVTAELHLAGVADADLGALERQADGAELVVVRPVDEARAGRFGQPVTLQDQNAWRFEPFGDVAVQRCGTRDEEPYPPPEHVADLGEHQPVEQPLLRYQMGPDEFAFAATVGDLFYH